MTDGARGRVVRAVRMPGETWVAHLGGDGRLVDLMLRRDAEQALWGAIHLARLARRGGRGAAATATLADGRDLWLDPAPRQCALTGRSATDGALLAVRIVEEARAGKLPRASGRIELRGRRLALIAGESGERLSHRLTDAEGRRRLAAALARLPAGQGAWLATRWAADVDEDLLGREAAGLVREMERVRARASMAGAPVELAAPRDPVAECLFERLPAGPFRAEANTAALKRELEAAAGMAWLEGQAPVDLALGLEGPWDDPDVAGPLAEALSPTVGFAGGRLHIEPTRALTAIDVDGDPALGFAQVNRRAAAAVLAQLRLREIGGLVVVDPAGPGTPQTAKAMIAAMDRSAGDDPYALKIQPGGAGLVVLVRERRRPSLAERLGRGGGTATAFEASPATVALRALARTAGEAGRKEGGRLALEIAAPVAHYLQETEAGRAALAEAEAATAREIRLVGRPDGDDDRAAVRTEGEDGNG